MSEIERLKNELWNLGVSKTLSDKRSEVLEKKASSLGAKCLHLTKLLQTENELLIKEKSTTKDLTELVEKLKSKITE